MIVFLLLGIPALIYLLKVKDEKEKAVKNSPEGTLSVKGSEEHPQYQCHLVKLKEKQWQRLITSGICEALREIIVYERPNILQK